MWSAIATLVLGAIRWLFGQRQQSEGVAQGRAEQGQANAKAIIGEAEVAQQVRSDSDHRADVDGVRRADEFERPDTRSSR